MLLFGLITVTGMIAPTQSGALPATAPRSVTYTISTVSSGFYPGPSRAKSIWFDAWGITPLRSGSFLVSDTTNDVVREVSPTGVQTVVAGYGGEIPGAGGYFGDRGPATHADLWSPYGIATDSSGDIFIADWLNNRVRMVAASNCSSSCAYGLSSTKKGDIYTVAGSGQLSTLGDRGPATSAGILPTDVAVDSSGDLLIADSWDNRIRLVAASSCSSSCPFGLRSMDKGDIYTVAGDGVSGYAGDGVPATTAELSGPYGVLVDHNGDIVIADTGNDLVRLVAASNCSSSCPFGLASTKRGDIYTIAGDPNPGGSGEPATSANLAATYGVTQDASGDLVISEDYYVLLVAASNCSSSCPLGLSSMRKGDVYTVAGDGLVGTSGDGGPATSAMIPNPRGVAFDSHGNLLIAVPTDGAVRMVAASNCSSSCAYGLSSTKKGDIYTVAGGGNEHFSGDKGPAIDAGLWSPNAVAESKAGDVFIADTENDRIRMVAASNCSSSCAYGLPSTTKGDIYTVAGDGIGGGSGDGAAAIDAELDGPSGVAVDSAGNVLIADQFTNRLRMIAAVNCSSSCAYGLASTTKGDIYTVAGDGTGTYSGDGGVAEDAGLNEPSGVAVDASGDVAIADYGNERVRIVAGFSCSSSCPFGFSSMTKHDIYTLAGNGDAGAVTSGSRAGLSSLDEPTSVAFTPSGNLVIANSGDNGVDLVARKSCSSGCPYGLASMTAGDIYVIAGSGSPGMTGDGGPGKAAELKTPVGVAADASGDILIADTGNNEVRLVAASTCSTPCPFGLASTKAGDIYLVAGDGTFGYFGDGGPPAKAHLANPTGLAVSSGGHLYIADTDNNCIREVA